MCAEYLAQICQAQNGGVGIQAFLRRGKMGKLEMLSILRVTVLINKFWLKCEHAQWFSKLQLEFVCRKYVYTNSISETLYKYCVFGIGNVCFRSLYSLNSTGIRHLIRKPFFLFKKKLK